MRHCTRIDPNAGASRSAAKSMRQPKASVLMHERSECVSTLDDTLMALADPTRRAILQTLSLGEARVTELARPFPMSLNAVSKHIRVLERANLVRRRRAGRDHFLAVNPRALDAAASWIETQRAAWTARIDTLEALLAAEDEAAGR
jgi:DNA-binding transcriptional ArsR family regulator